MLGTRRWGGCERISFKSFTCSDFLQIELLVENYESRKPCEVSINVSKFFYKGGVK
jgi:hypothetical protein